MTEKIIIRDFDALQGMVRGGCGPDRVEFKYGELAADLITYAMAEELLVALRGSLGEGNAKIVVGILLEAKQTHDHILDWIATDPDFGVPHA